MTTPQPYTETVQGYVRRIAELLGQAYTVKGVGVSPGGLHRNRVPKKTNQEELLKTPLPDRARHRTRDRRNKSRLEACAALTRMLAP